MPRARHPEPLLTAPAHGGDAADAGPTPSVRVDDLTPGGRSFELDDVAGVLVARDIGAVAATLERAAAAARAGHWVAGFVTYEAAPGLERGLAVRDPGGDVPLVWFGVFRRRVDRPRVTPVATRPARWELESDRATHAAQIAVIKARIAAGDTYQVNLTTRARTIIDDPVALYSAMSTAQGGAHNVFIDTGAHAVACASPELLFALDGDRLVTRPMKGTARRGRWPAEDAELAAALQASPKDRAENIMIVDLTRSDVGRLARAGSVEVPALMRLERYPTLWQLTSTVTGRLRPGTGLAEIFAAVFPAGSVTGAPKRRTMELIAELEGSPRRVYCGAIGVIEPGPHRRATFAVAIRTVTVERATGRAEYGAGGGITWGSQPDAEWDELVTKMRVLDHPPSPEGLLETLLVDGCRGPRHLDRHLARMQASAAQLSIPFDEASVRDAVARLAPDARRVRLRITVARDGEIGLDTSEAPHPDPAAVRLVLADTPVSSRDPWLFHKTIDRSRYDAWRGAAGREADDVILWNERDEVTETTVASLAVRLADRWWTPPLDCGLLPGVERARLLECGTLHERVLTVADVRQATSLAVINSLRGWRSARLVR